MAITSQHQRAGFPLTLKLTSKDLPKEVKISQIRTLAIERIGNKICNAAPEELLQVIEGLNEIIETWEALLFRKCDIIILTGMLNFQ